MDASHPTQRSLNKRPLMKTVLAGVLAGACLVGGLARVPVAAARGSEADRAKLEDRDHRKRRRRVIAKGAKWLAAQQSVGGSWGDTKAVIAITSLSILALMSTGSTDGRGPYGRHVRRGIDFLLKLIEQKPAESEWPAGYFEHAGDTASRMHGQGYATLALASALGTATSAGRVGASRHERIRKVLVKAVECCELAQTPTGGYGYKPTRSAVHEGSVTVAVAQGLRAARDVGVVIDRAVVDRGLRYLRNSQKEDGSFRYSTSQDTSSYALTAAALSAFFLFGQYEDGEKRLVSRGIKAMRRYINDDGPRHRWYYYGHFYAAWACWQKDGHTWDPNRSLWGWWQKKIYRDLMVRQINDGSFEREQGKFVDFGDQLTTAFAILTLSIPDEGLPIFQR